MSTHKHIDKICCIAVVLALLITVVFMNGKSLGIVSAGKTMGYENRLFSTDRVHTVDIVMNDWEGFIETCENEEYSACSVVIDGENYGNVGIRAKGNTSLSNVSSMNSDRYSFKLEFDQYDETKSYYGLDKISLNNIIQDNTFMKDYLVYRMMGESGVAAPLCSYVYITVNGEDWGLYLAVEGIEDGFLQRNYGNDYGELYKPDNMSFGGGRGNGKDFDFSEFENSGNNSENSETENKRDENSMPTPPEGFGGGREEMSELPEGADTSEFGGKGNRGGFGSFSIDEEAVRAALEEQGIDPSVIDGIDFSSLTPELLQELMGKLEGVDFNKLFEAVMGSGNMPQMPGGEKGGFGGKGGDDVKLKYTDDSFDSYSNIFDNAKTDITDADKTRLIESLKTLGSGENVESVVDIEQVIKYFVVHNFVVNGDSYTGNMIHNYYLYEKDGVMSMLPWDYNLAFGGFQSADATSSVNEPIDSPVSGGDISDRPMIAWIFESEEYTNLYHEYFSEFISEYFNSGYFEEMFDKTVEIISPYVEKDPTKFCDYDSFVLGASTLKKFCMLRAESVEAQLCGTISSSTEDRNSESSLVDASGINISDMGSMMQSDGRDGRGEMPDMFEKPQTNQPSEPQTELASEEAAEASTTQDSTEETTQAQTVPEIPQTNGEFQVMPPDGEIPAMPHDGNNPFENGGTPPDMPSMNGEMPQMPQGGAMPPFGNGEAPPQMPVA